ncbi:glutamate 5-kinase [Streptosporangium roseum]|uniref:Glutamate 5-kinase n=1 Tax=Streptosporangium roseum (strain ATCC 12428 / DSM 43021 / JCM 3005 / KCTC 9067 / NCIMB 10171 / NRRL 2505 / NI 9100) TaxID=479432 RepID=D2BCC6_STRRD|nr:glutamate 5-kinase [Streptosporangium roseum]ACZ89955.1 Glutamate 5-kinase [Streptosporangium roseum DSM 43021]
MDSVRDRIRTASRLVVKVGSSSLTTAQGMIDVDRVDALVDVLAARRGTGTQIVLVSSGAIAAGLGPLGLSSRPRDLATQQAAASVGQGVLVARYTSSFARYGLRVGQVLLTADDMMRRSHHVNAQRTLGRLLELGIVPVVNENDTVATDEIRFGDNDRLAALVAHLTRADALVLLSDVDALYDGDPRRPGARRLGDVRGPEDLVGVELGKGGAVGTGGMVTKVQAARIATGAGVPVVLTAAAHAAQALAGVDIGTCFHPDGRHPGTRLLWLAHATTGRGRLHLDPGAVEAVVGRRKSLLPAGVTAVEGDFAAGDPVDLCGPLGRVVARGLVNFDAVEIPGLLGRSTRELATSLGPEYERELIHRDDIVILESHH